MFVFKKLITPFLLPPGLFIVFLLFATFWLTRRKNWQGALFTGTAALLLWLAAASPVADRLVAGFENGLSMPRSLHGDVIILLGGGMNEGVRDLTGKGAPSDEMMTRIVTAVRAQRELHVPIIVSAGAVFPERIPEAYVVKRFLYDLGVAKDMVIVEDKSRDTAENAEYTVALCVRHGFRRPLLVTSALHMRRAITSFAVHKMVVLPLPATLENGPPENYIWTDYLPKVSALERISYVFHEYLGLLFYRLTK